MDSGNSLKTQPSQKCVVSIILNLMPALEQTQRCILSFVWSITMQHCYSNILKSHIPMHCLGWYDTLRAEQETGQHMARWWPVLDSQSACARDPTGKLLEMRPRTYACETKTTVLGKLHPEFSAGLLPQKIQDLGAPSVLSTLVIMKGTCRM